MPRPARDYQPLIKGLTLIYAHVDYDSSQPEVSRMIWRVEDVAKNGGVKTARVSVRWGDSKPRLQELRADDQGVWAGKNLEIRLPPKLNDKWEVADDFYYARAVFSLKAKASAMSKDFENCLEVGFSNEDTDSGSRLYAPGIGLVREQRSGETYNSVLSLAHWEIPKP